MVERKDLRRLGAVLFVIAVVVVLILWRYSSLMLFGGKGARDLDPPLLIERGPILDRNGRVLAIQTSLNSVSAWVPELVDYQSTGNTLADVLDMNQTDILEIFSERATFAWVKRKITPRESDAISTLTDEGKLPGIYVQQEYGRTYPEQKLASHILGIVDVDNIGLEGIELVYDSLLRPESTGDEKEVFGHQVFLTIDTNLQYEAEKLARNAVEENQAESVMLLVMDARIGDFLALAGAPDYNPNDYASFPAENRTNRPVATAYEPGSVFKIYSVAAMLELDGIGSHSEFLCRGYYEHPDIPDPISCLGVHGIVGPTEIIKYSCNAGAAYASETVDTHSFYNLLRRFGFGTATSLPLPGESNGLLDQPSQWSVRTKPTLAFGQEISTSAVQIITAATVFANSGVLLEPHIVKKIVSADGKIVERFDRTPIAEVVSPSTAGAMLAMMEKTTEPGGTAIRAKVDGVRVSAKTGTAQVYDSVAGAYSTESFVASCLAILPSEDPQIIVYAVIQDPQAGEYLGGRIAAPVVREMAEEAVRYLGIPREGDQVLPHPGVVRLAPPEKIEIGDYIPDFTGLAKRQLLPLLDDSRVRLRIEGEGWVTKQFPAPGTPVESGMLIILDLE